MLTVVALLLAGCASPPPTVDEAEPTRIVQATPSVEPPPSSSSTTATGTPAPEDPLAVVVLTYDAWLFLPPGGTVDPVIADPEDVEVAGGGQVWMTVHVRMDARVNATYAPADWTLRTGDEPAEPAELDFLPSPRLGSGELAAGERVEGWLAWRAPMNTAAMLTHEPTDSIFELEIPSALPSPGQTLPPLTPLP